MSNALKKLSEPYLKGNEWEYIKDCLDSGWVSSVGKYVDLFEKRLAEYVDCSHAVAVSSGTAALHLACVAAGVGAGDAVIVPTFTFIASANAVRYCGAEPIFVDCEKQSLGIDVEALKSQFEKNTSWQSGRGWIDQSTGLVIKAIMPVHVYGMPCQIEALREFCREKDLLLIEDATESLGSHVNGQMTGRWGQLGCFSFNGNKIITTGGGGMIVTHDESLAQRIRHLSTQAKISQQFYEHDLIGYNYRMTNIQSAMGVAQLEQLPKILDKKRQLAQAYVDGFKDFGQVHCVYESQPNFSNHWFLTVIMNDCERDDMMAALTKQNIQVRPVWTPLHTQACYKSSRLWSGRNAEDLFASALNLPMSVHLSVSDIKEVVGAMREYFLKK